MKKLLLLVALVIAARGTLDSADEPAETFHAYVDTDICARLMLGLIDQPRISCTMSTAKEGAQPVLIRMANNMVLDVNNQKKIKKLTGQFMQATGWVKAKDGTMKLDEVSPETEKDIPANDPARRLLDPRNFQRDPQVYEKVRHELAMMPYISDFDFISYNMVGSEVILTGWTVRQTNRNDAYSRVKSVPGVETVINNIDVLPLGSNDMQVRAQARARLQQQLGRYFWSNGSDIKVIVKDGDIILLGNVYTKADSDTAFIQCNQVQGAFHVFNLLRVTGPTKEKG
jgi:osmotically-inducible protein OsmY